MAKNIFIIHIFFLLTNSLCPANEDLSVIKYETDLLKIINAYRAKHSLIVLKFDEQLYRLAKEHSIYMQNQDKLSHDNFNQRFEKSGYMICVENVGFLDRQSPDKQFEMWRDSTKHNKNMLTASITVAGIAKSGGYTTFIGGGDRN